MKLEKRVQKDWASIQRRANAMFMVYSNDIGAMIEAASKDVIGSIAATLSMHPEISYKTLQSGGTLDRLSATIKHRFNNLSIDIEHYWGQRREDYDLFSRLAVGFVSMKTSPPWIKKKLDLKTEPKDGRYDPRKGHLRFYFAKMADAVVNQVSQGALNEQTLNQILTRVRNMFNRRSAKGVREGAFDPYSFSHDVEITADGEYQDSLTGSVDIHEGTYSLEDVERLQLQQQRAMNWESRQYRPWFTDEVKRNNRYLRELEQLLMSDAIDQMHSGQLQQQMGYPDEMGIEDFQWIVSHPGTCDCCDSRAELTTAEISEKIKDDYGDDPPPLHPNCRCQLAPKIKDDWADKVLKDAGQEWDPETGVVYHADSQERDSGIQDMTFDEYMALIPRG